MDLEVQTVDGETHVLPCDAALFDADGTLYTGYEDGPVEVARCEALQAFGFVVPPFERLRGLAGEHVLIVIEKFQIGEDRARLHVDWEGVLTHFRAQLQVPEVLTPLPDASELLHRIGNHALPVGITTNSSKSSWMEKAGKLPSELLNVMNTVVTMTCVGDKPKPHPDMLFEGARRLSARKPILFGDSKADARAARNAGMPSIIRRAGRPHEELQWIRAYNARIVEDFSKVRILS